MSHLFDSNNFLRLAEKNNPKRQIVLDAIRKRRAANEIIYYTPQVLAEFWNVCSRPANVRGGLNLTVEQTDRKATLIQKYFALLPDNVASFTEWRHLFWIFRYGAFKFTMQGLWLR